MDIKQLKPKVTSSISPVKSIRRRHIGCEVRIWKITGENPASNTIIAITSILFQGSDIRLIGKFFHSVYFNWPRENRSETCKFSYLQVLAWWAGVWNVRLLFNGRQLGRNTFFYLMFAAQCSHCSFLNETAFEVFVAKCLTINLLYHFHSAFFFVVDVERGNTLNQILFPQFLLVLSSILLTNSVTNWSAFLNLQVAGTCPGMIILWLLLFFQLNAPRIQTGRCEGHNSHLKLPRV